MPSGSDDEEVGCDCDAGTRGAGGPLMLLGFAGLAVRRRRRRSVEETTTVPGGSLYVPCEK